MFINFFCSLFFFSACYLQAKDIFIDLEGYLINRSSVCIYYYEDVNTFTPKELLEGVEKSNLCDIYIYSNLKQALEVVLSSKSIKWE